MQRSFAATPRLYRDLAEKCSKDDAGNQTKVGNVGAGSEPLEPFRAIS
jgi:hypothetical protein